jgi:hypothetical protein
MSAKSLLRRLMVATCVPPFEAMYRGVYWLFIWLAVWRLRQFSSLRAVYLRGGMAGAESVPGISDIDLTAIGDWDTSAREQVAQCYRRLASLCPLYDPGVAIYTPESLAKLFRIEPFHRHHLGEGRRQWKLLFGDDCLSGLAAGADHGPALGYESEIKVWWADFARGAFSASSSDPVLLNSRCYKTVAECFRMDCGLRGKSVPESRGQAIEEALSSSNCSADAAFLRRLAQSARRRHLNYSGDILEDSREFLLGFLERSYRHLESHSPWRARPEVALRVDAPEDERIHTARTLPNFDAIVQRARELWGADACSVRLVCGTAFAMDEVVLMLEPLLADRLPRVDELSALAQTGRELLGSLRSRFSLFVRLPFAAYQFCASDYFHSFQAILSRSANPEMFLPCGQLETGATHSSSQTDEPAFWTEPAAIFVHQERLQLAERLEDRAVYKANNLDFLRMFWKFLELVVTERSTGRGEVLLAHTPEAVVRALEFLNLPRAPFLESFAAAYRAEVAGSPANIGRWIPPAVQYLKTVHHDF